MALLPWEPSGEASRQLGAKPQVPRFLHAYKVPQPARREEVTETDG